jgi:hypothetical protein
MDDMTLGNSTNPIGDSEERMKRDIEERGKPGKTSMKCGMTQGNTADHPT